MIRRVMLAARNAIVGLNAIHARFDLLQNSLDALRNADARAGEIQAQIEQAMREAEDRLSKSADSGLDAMRARFYQLQNSVDALVPAIEAANKAVGQRGLADPGGAGGEPVGSAGVAAPLARGHAHRNHVQDAPRLAFLVHTLELCNHFGPVWDVLPPGSFDVLLHGTDEAQARVALRRWRCTARNSQDVLDSGVAYAFLVSNHPVELGDPPLIKRLAIHNVRFMYAAGKSGWNLSAWNALYDVILSFGPHHTQALSTVCDATIVQMGYPRFDRYFTEEVSRADLMLRYGCDPARQTVVWLPTWKDLSSVGWFDQEVSALTARYNVVVKLHPLMVEHEAERVESIRKHAFNCLITDSSDNLPLYQLADYMLFDYGGPPMAALYADKNMLLLDVPGADTDPLLGADSPDMQIRQVLGSLSHGEARIAEMLTAADYWQKQAPQRKQLRQPYFAPHYGFSAQVAASALMRLESLVANKT